MSTTGREARCSASRIPLPFRKSSHLVKHTHCEALHQRVDCRDVRFVLSFFVCRDAAVDFRSGLFDVSAG